MVLNAKLPWPAKVDLPNNFRPEIARALTEKDPAKFTAKMRKSFIARISVLYLLSKGSLPEDIIKSNEGASLTIC